MTLGQLEAMGDAVNVETYDTLTWEHLDFNFRDKSAFADANGGLKLREAFAEYQKQRAAGTAPAASH